MIKFINKLTGSDMWVADDRKAEYEAAGHVLAAKPAPEEKPAKKPPKKKGAVKK